MRISFLSGPYEGASYSFDYDIVVGRDSSADLSLPLDPSVSRKHLKISTQGNRIIIEDLNSTNGTFCIENRKVSRIHGRREFSGSVLIRIGSSVMEVVV